MSSIDPGPVIKCILMKGLGNFPLISISQFATALKLKSGGAKE